MKKDEALPFAATWMDLESITLSEIRRSVRKAEDPVISLVRGTQN